MRHPLMKNIENQVPLLQGFAPTLDGALMNITCVRLYIADILCFKASSDTAQDLAGGPRQTLPRLVSACVTFLCCAALLFCVFGFC